MSAENERTIASLAGDWKAQDGSVLYIDETGRVEKNHNPFPVSITFDADQGQLLFNAFTGELVSPDVILWRSPDAEAALTLWTRLSQSADVSSAFDSNLNSSPDPETAILEHSEYRRTIHRHRTFASVPVWVPAVLEFLLAGIFTKIKLSKFGFARLEFLDLLDRDKLHAVHASVDFFRMHGNTHKVNVVFPQLAIEPIFPFREISVHVSVSEGDLWRVLCVDAPLTDRAQQSYSLGIPLPLSENLVMRELKPLDAAMLFKAVQTSSHLDRFLSNFVKETGASLTRCEWALEAWQRSSRIGNSVHLGIVREGELLGVVHIDKNFLGSHRVAVVEYWLAASATGKGLAPVMVVAGLHWAREALQVNLAHFDVHPDNEGSVKVLLKVGAELVKKKKKKSKDEKIFQTFRLTLDDAWSLFRAARRPWMQPRPPLPQVPRIGSVTVCPSPRTHDDTAVETTRQQNRQRRHSLSHVTYFSREVASIDTPGSLAHQMRIPVTGPGIALRQVFGASASSGSWFIVFVKEFDWNSPTRHAVLALKAFWPGEGYYFGLEHVASVVDLNQCDSSDQRESIINRFKLSLQHLPQGRLLCGGQLVPYEGDLANIDAIRKFLNAKTPKSPIVSSTYNQLPIAASPT